MAYVRRSPPLPTKRRGAPPVTGRVPAHEAVPIAQHARATPALRPCPQYPPIEAVSHPDVQWGKPLAACSANAHPCTRPQAESAARLPFCLICNILRIHGIRPAQSSPANAASRRTACPRPSACALSSSRRHRAACPRHARPSGLARNTRLLRPCPISMCNRANRSPHVQPTHIPVPA